MISTVFSILKKEPIICAPLIIWALLYELFGMMFPELLMDPFSLSPWVVLVSFLKIIFAGLCILLCSYSYLDLEINFQVILNQLKKSLFSLSVVFCVIEIMPRLAMIYLLDGQSLEQLMDASASVSKLFISFSFFWGLLALSFIVSHHYILLENHSGFRALLFSAKFVRTRLKTISFLLMQIILVGMFSLALQAFLIMGPEWFNGFISVIRGGVLGLVYCMVTVFFIDELQPKLVNTLID